MLKNTFPHIHDAETLEAELDKFPHLRNHHNFTKLRSDCDTYFHTLQYQDAHERGEISLYRISKVVGTTDIRVAQWLAKDKEPRLLWLINHERTQTAFLEHLLHTESNRETPTNPILRAANDHEYRQHLLPPGNFTPQHIEHLINLRSHQDTSRDPTQFTTITSLQDYEAALCAFPLIQTLSNFDCLHHHMHLYFRLKDNPPHKTNGKLPIGAITQHYGLTKGCIHNWLKNTTQPDLKTTLEHRAYTLKAYKAMLHNLRQQDHGITTPHHLTTRLSPNHFHFSHHITTDPQYPNHLTDATRYLFILQLVDASHHPADLDRHFHLHKDYTGDTLRYHHRPHLIKLTATIPNEAPELNHRWLPTTTDETGRYPARYINAPYTINGWQQILPLLDQLPNPNNPDIHLTRQLDTLELDEKLINQRIKEYGQVKSSEERVLTFAYLIGTALGDGWVQQQSTISSSFGIELSKRYYWAKSFGERTAHYWTQLGIPTKEGEGRKISKNRPHGLYNWYSVTTPFLTYFNEEVLGFKPGETHTYFPAKIDWVLQSPKEFQIKILQGLFDSDGWTTPSGYEIGIHSHQNRDLIKELLQLQGIRAKEYGEYELKFHSYDTIKKAVNLPLFLSATEKYKRALYRL